MSTRVLFQDANDLEDKYNDVANQLDSKYNETRQAKDRADRLRDRAAKLYQDTYEKLERLRGECHTPGALQLREFSSVQRVAFMRAADRVSPKCLTLGRSHVTSPPASRKRE